jgi:hypothetical protein
VKLVRRRTSFCRSASTLPEFAAIGDHRSDRGKYGKRRH